MNSGSCGQMTTLCAIVNLTLQLLESNFGDVISNVNERISSRDKNLFLFVSVSFQHFFFDECAVTLSNKCAMIVEQVMAFFLKQNRYHDTSITH